MREKTKSFAPPSKEELLELKKRPSEFEERASILAQWLYAGNDINDDVFKKVVDTEVSKNMTYYQTYTIKLNPYTDVRWVGSAPRLG